MWGSVEGRGATCPPLTRIESNLRNGDVSARVHARTGRRVSDKLEPKWGDAQTEVCTAQRTSIGGFRFTSPGLPQLSATAPGSPGEAVF